MNKIELVRKAMHLPYVGPLIEKKLLEFYKPYERGKELEDRGPHGERYYFEQLAHTRYDEDWMFKVYTSEFALENLGIVTTIYLERHSLLQDILESNPRYVHHEFKKAQHRYEIFMHESLTNDEWQRVANGQNFKINATNKVATTMNGEMTVDEYVKSRLYVKKV